MTQENQNLSPENTTEAQRIAYNATYRLSLESVLRSALEDFNRVTYDLKKFQFSTIKTYLWIATVVFAAQLAFYADIAVTHNLTAFIGLQVDIQAKVFKTLSVLSLLLSLGVFLLGIDTMRGRNIVHPPWHSWKDLADMAYEDCDTDYMDRHRIALIQQIDAGIASHLIETNSIGKKLRTMSWGLLVSVVCAVLTVFC